MAEPVNTPDQSAEYVAPLERHVQVETLHWETKVRCSCGADFASRAEFWKHGYEALQALIERTLMFKQAEKEARKGTWGDASDLRRDSSGESASE